MPRYLTEAVSVPPTNGLSTWYDMLRNNPATLSSPLKQRDFGLEHVKGMNEVSRDIIQQSAVRNKKEATFFIAQDEEEVSSLIKFWRSKVLLLPEHTIPELESEEMSPINPRICVRSDPYHGFSWGSRELFKYIYDGASDEDGMFHGEGTVSFKDGGEVTGSWCHGARSGKCAIANHDETLRIKGMFKMGKLCGKGTILRETFTVDGYFRDGCLQGLCTIEDISGSLLVGRFTSGVPEGRWWQFIRAGGFLLGDLEMTEDRVSILFRTRFSVQCIQCSVQVSVGGRDCVYVYPDCVTALVGDFRASQLIRARAASVTEARVERGVCRLR